MSYFFKVVFIEEIIIGGNMKKPVLSGKEAVKKLIKDGDTLAVGGFVGGAHPEQLTKDIQEVFLETGKPRDLTLIYAAGQGDGDTKGLNHLGEEGLVKKVIGGHWGLAPRLQKLANENKVEAYNIPQGVISRLFREIAAGNMGVFTSVGLRTFADPRVEGGKINDKAREAGDVVKLVEIEGKEQLLYLSQKLDVALIRATYADTEGNAVMSKEGTYAETLSIAQAVKNSGGTVILQVESVVEYGCLDPRLVKVPGIYVDYIVVAEPENAKQSFATQYNPAYSGETRIPLDSLKPLALDARKIVARRAAMELVPNAITNLGIGMPEGVASVAAEEGLEGMILTTESGTIGGVPAGGGDFGMTTNPDAILDQPYQFDFYDGGGLDVAFLGLAQMDAEGNINVSKFGPKIPGCGGFIDITQNSKKVVYCGTFKAAGLKVHVDDGKLVIDQEGKVAKLIEKVEQITFSGVYANEIKQPVLYITERAVFELTPEGVELKEIAPGLDLQKDVLDQMEFKPIVNDVKLMDERIFKDELMGLEL